MPLFQYLHDRYLRYFLEQDVIGHMESDFGLLHARDQSAAELHRGVLFHLPAGSGRYRVRRHTVLCDEVVGIWRLPVGGQTAVHDQHAAQRTAQGHAGRETAVAATHDDHIELLVLFHFR